MAQHIVIFSSNCISISCNERLYDAIISRIRKQCSIVSIPLMLKTAFKYKKEYPHIYLIVI